MEAQDAYYSSGRAKFSSYRGGGKGGGRRRGGFGRSNKVVSWRSGQEIQIVSHYTGFQEKPILYMLMVKFLCAILVDQFLIGHMHVQILMNPEIK